MLDDGDFRDVTLLCVEDDRTARDRLCNALSRRYPGLKIFTGNNGVQGLESFARNRPEVVLTDIQMPGTDGITMAAGIKADSPATEIIALTAHGEADLLLHAMEAGITRYILKPVVLERLFEAIDGMVARIRDKRRIERLHAELARKAMELEHLNTELEAFASTVAHDLRAPLASMATLAELLLVQQGALLDSSAQGNLGTLHTELTRMSGLIEKMLDFSRCLQGGIDKQWTDLSALAREVAEDLRYREPQRNVVFHIADGVHGFGDPILLRVVLENLFSNAWKYSAAAAEACIGFGSFNTDVDQVYFVKDNGEGFDQHEAPHLFDDFHREGKNPSVGGFGIGLSTVRRIIQRHGGRIWATGNPGSGAEFFFTL